MASDYSVRVSDYSLTLHTSQIGFFAKITFQKDVKIKTKTRQYIQNA